MIRTKDSIEYRTDTSIRSSSDRLERAQITATHGGPSRIA